MNLMNMEGKGEYSKKVDQSKDKGLKERNIYETRKGLVKTVSAHHLNMP